MKIGKTAADMAGSMIFVILGAAFLLFPKDSADTVRRSLVFTVSTVIPALFPFMVVSKVLAAQGTSKTLISLIDKPAYKLFGLRRSALTAVILGFISGFPIGAATVCEAYKNNELSKKEAERAAALAHNTGPSFPIGLVGAVLWKSKAFGVFLYSLQLFSWMIAASVFKADTSAKNSYSKAVDGKRQDNLPRTITNAVAASASACVSIAGFTSFMQLCADSAVLLMPKMSFYADAVLSSLFEFSSGCVKAASVGGAFGCALTGFAIGFGGLSAFLQGASYMLNEGLSVSALVKVKLFQGVFCSILSAIFAYVYPMQPKSVIGVSVIPFSVGSLEEALMISVIILFFAFKIYSKHGKTS